MSKDVESLVDTVICGDALEVMRDFPDGFIDCCVTSPPYWGLRDYGVAGQLGLEKTPEEYVDKMVEVFAEVKRVLKKEGTLWLNLGDSYASDSKGSGGTHYPDGRPYKQLTNAGSRYNVRKCEHGLKPKDLCGIPWRIALALQADGWYLRQDIIWSKPNPMPESVTDRCTKAHEYIFLLSKSARYYYDAEAIKETATTKPHPRGNITIKDIGGRASSQNVTDPQAVFAPDGKANKRSVWTVATAPYKEAHFATFPPKLIEPCILAGCPKQVCKKCGKARVRITENKPMELKRSNRRNELGMNYAKGTPSSGTMVSPPEHKTTGWTDCGCNAGFRPGIVFDPFMGSGTVAEVAIKLKRSYTGSEIKQKYIGMGRVYAAETGVPVAEQKAGQMALFDKVK
jgi:site-specific DNA-methyltransferase (adenine-specific)